MDVRDFTRDLAGAAIDTPRRTLSEREMARVIGGGPPVNVVEDDGCGKSWSWVNVNGTWVINDCVD